MPNASLNKQVMVFLQSIDSTNNYAHEQLNANMAEHGSAFFAYDQTSGKGQRDKQWITEAGQNIVLSVVLDSSFLQIHQLFALNIISSLAMFGFFSKYAHEYTSIKWANDLYWNDRKAGGVLIENRIGSKNVPLNPHPQRWSIIGMGININQTVFDAALPNPVSLKQITGRQYNIEQMAAELYEQLMDWHHQLQKDGFHALLETYNKHLYKRKAFVKLKKENMVFNCTIESVDEHGRLIVSGAAQEHFNFGEVGWVV